ncbi:uncharacterized protein LOC121864008 [Homarus americanus]|uniref:uncharacterized protein LOC121864008 n=1 Tax=Homarus americanus TaxID=6706 RepID=UPI001C470236|nr:uncharacterized protein LOC121864008 [Homarus americanus]
MGPPIAGAVADKLGNFKLFLLWGGGCIGDAVTPPAGDSWGAHPPGVALTLITDHHQSELPNRQVIHRLAEVLPKAETGNTVDAEYLSLSSSPTRRINIGSAAPTASVNITSILKAKNFS